MEVLQISEDLLLEIEQDPAKYQGRIIDLSSSPSEIIMHLDSVYAAHRGVTRKQLAIQVAENRIRDATRVKNIKTVCFPLEKASNTDICDPFLDKNYIILLKP